MSQFQKPGFRFTDSKKALAVIEDLIREAGLSEVLKRCHGCTHGLEIHATGQVIS